MFTVVFGILQLLISLEPIDQWGFLQNVGVKMVYTIRKLKTEFDRLQTDFAWSHRIYASLSILSKELKNGIDVLVDQTVISLDQNSQNIVLISNSRTAWPT